MMISGHLPWYTTIFIPLQDEAESIGTGREVLRLGMKGIATTLIIGNGPRWMWFWRGGRKGEQAERLRHCLR